MIKLIRYHLPPIVKHVLAPQNYFGMPIITWSNHKSFGIEGTPPPPVEKNSQIVQYFFWHRPLPPLPWNSQAKNHSLCCSTFGRKCRSPMLSRRRIGGEGHQTLQEEKTSLDAWDNLGLLINLTSTYICLFFSFCWLLVVGIANRRGKKKYFQQSAICY